MKPQHKHEFKAKRPNPTVLICDCGRFQNVISESNPAIVGIEKPQHTPGPWEACQDPMRNLKPEIITSDHRRHIASVDNEANARLIACSPEMLEALKNAVDLLRHHEIKNGWAENVVTLQGKAIIAKAEGRE